MYKKIKKKIDSTYGKTQYVLSDLYDILTMYETDKSNIDTVIDTLWYIFTLACSDSFAGYVDTVSEVFTDILKFFTRSRKGFYEKFDEYIQHDAILIEGFMCDEYALKYVTDKEFDVVLPIYKLYLYFRFKKCM